ncbi:trancriptional regulatory protein, MarR family [Thioalkalivibrio nitratireducens DSM 14787]|uniref:Trancriptional regulatory protein, MarR family n=1 Tax=Thioalkalivibrio nitratireducens (strain DSM 14787 / UNIQEM 213 / ALEN2) TaxID=1255043 RepID=L0DSA9_THIND|nr:MarR family winged helix-turn-helix transcriptional regulator [Thioalkalivibrio nitratireducens]AGA31867.1 trancriptional regulatory protein, MarR family [Thioalkalivibrio nitratireducens DSM 14787]
MDSSRLHELIERIGVLLRTEARRLGADAALQPVHLQALLYLERCNRYSNTPAALGAYLGQTKGTVSQSLKLLEREGYLTKRDDPDDRRVVRLALTARGRGLLAETAAARAWSRAEATLAEHERKAMTEGLERLLQGLQRAHGGRTFGICRSCRHFQTVSEGGHRCGLTGEALSDSDSRLICHEHEWQGSA